MNTLTRYPFLLLLGFCAACSSNDKPEANASTATSAPTAAVEKAPPTNANAAIDEKNGFRTYHFGDDISMCPDLEYFMNLGKDVRIYHMKKSKENMKIGDAPLESISYSFYKGKFYETQLDIVGGYTGLDKVIAALESLYGKPTEVGKISKWASWTGQKAKAVATMANSSRDARLTITSLPISKQIEEEEKAASQEGGSKAKADL
ncbi:hypothetical protein [Hymenobacter sp.]|jgi:hypothetical protein|uniref:hypothetical protein n=1 Tax=Hymenobacter sp. TaxID=1898978 RepID=UPI002EDAF423